METRQDAMAFILDRLLSGRGLDQVFSYNNKQTGELLHFDVEPMFKAAVEGFLEKKPICDTLTLGLNDEIYQHVLQHHGIEEAKVARLCEPYLYYPIIIADFGETQAPVDGNHRIIKLYRMGIRRANAFLFKRQQWEKFLVQFPPELDAALREQI